MVGTRNDRSGGTGVPICLFLASILSLILSLGGCAGYDVPSAREGVGRATSASSGSSGAVVAPPAPAPVLSFNEAIAAATDKMFQSFKREGHSGTGRLPFIIDPLIDGSTGAQTKATEYIQNKVIALAKDTQFEVRPFTPAELNKRPLVLIGTFNTINRAAEMKGERYAWWICLVMVDLTTGRVVARGVARAQLEGVDATPLEYFRDSPAWSEDDETSSYVKNCQTTKIGDLVDPKYLDGLLASSLIAQAIEAYHGRQYQQALDLYLSAAAIPGGDQLRLYTGLYLTNQKLGNRAAENESFRKLVAYGLTHRRLAVKFLFAPGSTVFINDQRISGQYKMWLEQIAREAAASDLCLEVTGHTTPTGLPPMNNRLSLLRAEYVKDRLDTMEPQLTPRTIANGVGSRENLVGIGKDDESDALDRRVEFKVLGSACGKAT